MGMHASIDIYSWRTWFSHAMCLARFCYLKNAFSYGYQAHPRPWYCTYSLKLPWRISQACIQSPGHPFVICTPFTAHTCAITGKRRRHATYSTFLLSVSPFWEEPRPSSAITCHGCHICARHDLVMTWTHFEHVPPWILIWEYMCSLTASARKRTVSWSWYIELRGKKHIWCEMKIQGVMTRGQTELGSNGN